MLVEWRGRPLEDWSTVHHVRELWLKVGAEPVTEVAIGTLFLPDEHSGELFEEKCICFGPDIKQPEPPL